MRVFVQLCLWALALAVLQDNINTINVVLGRSEQSKEPPAEPLAGDLANMEETITEHQVAFAICLILFAILIALILFNALHIYKIEGLPLTDETSLLIFFGFLFGAITHFIAPVLKPATRFSEFSFLLFLLPPIIFDAGYSMQRNFFFHHIVSILVFAIAGTLISATVIAMFMAGWCHFLECPSGLTTRSFEGVTATPPYMSSTPNVPRPLYSPPLVPAVNSTLNGPSADDMSDHIMSEEAHGPHLLLIDHVVFGSYISATDPVTVLALFKSIGADYDLYSLVFGESIFNDAVAMVLVNTAIGFTRQPVSLNLMMAATASFFYVLVVSSLFGIALGLICALLLKYMRVHGHSAIEARLAVASRSVLFPTSPRAL